MSPLVSHEFEVFCMGSALLGLLGLLACAWWEMKR